MSAIYFLLVGFTMTVLHHYKAFPFETENMALLAGLVEAIGILLVIRLVNG